jgi:hypothetical protein
LHHRSWIGARNKRGKEKVEETTHAPIEDLAILDYPRTAGERNNSSRQWGRLGVRE